jgi:NAD(P)-dependent dehydrogenase (short-subunit alcohol dehydrogenase family)
MNVYDLAGRRAVVTGGAGGIGTAIAAVFLESGAQVELWDRGRDALDAAVARLPGAEARAVDVTSEAAVESAAAAAGRIDVLVNAAGVLGEVEPIWRADADEFRRVVDVNLVGAWLATRAAIRRMRADPLPAGRLRHVVNIASIQGKEGMPMAGAYAASKAGLIALTKTVAKEVAADGIVVTCVAPAAAETAMARELTAARRTEIAARIPMGRFAETAEIARMTAWLASDDNSFSTGAVFDLSGGRATY